MSIISRLIVKEWLRVLAAALFSLTLLITTADIINGFLRGKNFTEVLNEYLLKMPDLMGKMLPVTCMLATLFCFNRLKEKSELIAIFASGFSYQRVYRLLIFLSFFMVGIQFLNLGYLEPYANKIKREKIAKSKINEGKFLTRSALDGGKFWYRTDRYFVSFAYFDRKTNQMIAPEVYAYNDRSLLTSFSTALSAKYENGVWMGDRLKTLMGLDSDDFPVENSEILGKLLINEVPEDFLEFEADLTTLPFDSLYRFIKRIKATGINTVEYDVMLYQKISLSLICLIFTLFPLSTIFNANRRSDSFGKSVIFTVVFTVVFWGIFSLTISLGQNGKLPAVFATALTPMIFLCYILYKFLSHRKLTF